MKLPTLHVTSQMAAYGIIQLYKAGKWQAGLTWALICEWPGLLLLCIAIPIVFIIKNISLLLTIIVVLIAVVLGGWGIILYMSCRSKKGSSR